jgi:hypothetical protein
MNATDDVTFDAPIQPVRKARKPRKAAAAKPQKPTAPYPGMTRTACADTCNAEKCAISGVPLCGHPCKGGLPVSLRNDRAALKRLQDAQGQLDVRLDPDRFK